MELDGEFHIPASPERVWRALNDPEILRRALPGCQELEKISDTEFTAKVTLKIGPVKATFKGRVTLSDLDPPNGYSIQGEGQGGVAGFAKGGARVTLAPDGDGTLLRYQASATVGGKLAQLGQRMIAGASRKLAGQFFLGLSEAIVSDSGTVAAEPPAPAAEEPPAPGLSLWVWVCGVLALAAALLWVVRG